MNGKKNKKPFSDPRWREWPKEGIKFHGTASKEVRKSGQKIINDLKEKIKQKHNN